MGDRSILYIIRSVVGVWYIRLCRIERVKMICIELDCTGGDLFGSSL